MKMKMNVKGSKMNPNEQELYYLKTLYHVTEDKTTQKALQERIIQLLDESGNI